MIKDLRAGLGLSQNELGERAGLSQPQVQRLESSKRKLTKEWATLLAPHLGTTPEFLMFGAEGDGSWQSLLKQSILLALEQGVMLTEIHQELGALLFSGLSDSVQQVSEQDPETYATVKSALEKDDDQSGIRTGRDTSNSREAR